MTFHELTSSLVGLLVSNAVYSTILFAVVLPLTILLRKHTPQIRYALWSIVLLRLVLPPSFALPGSIGDWLGRLGVSAGAGGTGPAEVALGTIDVTGQAEAGLTPEMLAAGFWVIGALVTIVLLLRARVRLSAIAKNGDPVMDESVLDSVDRLRSHLGIRRTVRVLATEGQSSAFTIGTLKPVIVLPKRMLERLDRDSVECVIAHELAHVRRFDDLTISLQAFVQGVYFFHPVAWLAGGFRSEESELICDQMAVLKGAIAPRSFGRSIVEALRLGVSPPLRVPNFPSDKRRMIMRIESVLRARPAHPLLTLALVAVALFILPLANSAAKTTPVDDGAVIAPASRADERPPKVEGDIVAPKVVEKVQPRYPEDAKAEKAQGVVKVEATIDEKGVVKDARILESPREDFSEAAMEAVRQWRFEPATLHGKAIAVRFTVTIRFRLE